MSVIDIHTHILEAYDNWKPEVHDFIRSYNPIFYDNYAFNMSLEGILKDMDESGIDYAVVLPEYAPITHGVITNEFVGNFCRKSKRLIPFASVNPNLTAHPAKELRLAIADFGFKGIKLIPTYNHFYPNESRMYPIYELAEELNIPVMIHTGSSVFKGSKLKYGDPLYLDEIAVDFPDLTIIQSHGGRGFWYDRAFFLAKLHQNVFIDLAGLPPRNLMKYFPELPQIGHKVIFGSDWPVVPSRKENIMNIGKLPLDNKIIEHILGGNAEGILRLKDT